MSEAAIVRTSATQVAIRPTSLWTRVGAAAGLVSMVVSTVGFQLHGDFPRGKSGQEIVQWAAGMNPTHFAVGIYVEIVGFLLFLLFAAWLWVVAREAEGGSGWISASGFVGAAILVGGSALDNGIWVALLNGARHGTDPRTLTTIRDMAEQLFAITFLFEGFFLVVTGYVLARTRGLLRWMGLSAVVFGMALFIPPIAIIAGLVFELGLVGISIFLLIRPSTLVHGHREGDVLTSG